MKKTILIIGIILLLLAVVFSGCDDRSYGTPVIDSGYHIYALTYEDTCSSVDPQALPGTVWVNYSVTNYGWRENVTASAQVYQGIGTHEMCGNGTIYNQTQSKLIDLNQTGDIALSFVFTGLDCTQGSNCYGVKTWIDEY